jgi:hypothetical protein
VTLHHARVAIPTIEPTRTMAYYPEYSKDMIMVNFIREWNMEDKIFAMTLDNASNNGAMMKLLKKHLLDKKMLVGGGKLVRQRCASHVINLVC